MAQAALQVSEAQLSQAQARVEAAKALVDQTQTQLDLLKAGPRAEDISVAESVVDTAKATLAEAQNNQADSVLKAPFDGVVGAVLINEGESVPAQAVIIRLGDMSRLCAQTQDLRETDITRVTIDQEATIRISALPGQTVRAYVTAVAPMATSRQGDNVFLVTLQLESEVPSGLRWGMNAFVDIMTTTGS